MCGPVAAMATPLGVPTKQPDIQSFDLVKFHEAAKDHQTEDEKEAFLTELLSSKGGRAYVADKMVASMMPAVFSYKHKKEGIKTTVACALFWMKVTVEYNGDDGLQTGHTQLGGLFSVGGGVYWGTLWYDNIDDINNASSVQVLVVGPSLTVTYFRPNGHAVGVYQAGGVSTCGGTGGGVWTKGT